MKLFRYKAFGLYIESEMEIPEFLPTSEEPEVFICLGEVPAQLVSPQFIGVRFQASPDQFLLRVDNIANYYAEAGHTITVQPGENSEMADVRLFLLGSVFGALIHQRGLLPMHGSSLVFGESAIIFSGVSGAGKSTLAAGFIKRGYKILSDDISVVSLSKQNLPAVSAGYPQMKLWADSLEKLGIDPNSLSRVRKQLNKHNLEVADAFESAKLPLSGIYILHTKNSQGIDIEELKGIEKFNALKNNTYRLNFVRGLGNTEANFNHLSAIAQNCFVRRLSRPSKGFSTDSIIDIIRK